MKPTENMGEDFNQGANFAYVKNYAIFSQSNVINRLRLSKDNSGTQKIRVKLNFVFWFQSLPAQARHPLRLVGRTKPW
jgi:hypothetical protein